MPNQERSAPERGSLCGGLVPIALALLMAAPSLRGGFLTGDDIQLVRDHVLVNRPSLTHLLELFSIPHRDLYQPVPLATFALNFAWVRWWGWGSPGAGPEAAAWLFHLTNVLIHALNAWLVWRLVRGLRGEVAAAVVAASLFAVHPLNVEPVAWLNGRMMMLSTTFTLAALLVARRMLDRPGVGHLLWTVLMVALAMMSKVSVGLPVLLLLVPWVRRCRPSRRWWVTFALSTVLTGMFAGLNFQLSRGQLETAGEVLEGPRSVRTVLALGWYLDRYFVPVGLAPWHPTEKLVTGSDPRIPAAAVTVALLLIVSGVLLRVSRTGGAGVIWFCATLAVTLPLVPSRNLMVAERYVYLPGIGVHWIMAVGCVQGVAALHRRGVRRAALTVGAGLAGAAATVALLAVSWTTLGYYRDNIARCLRTAELYPTHEGVWTRLAWAYYDAGEYAQAVRVADAELERHPEKARSDVWQVQGMALLRSGAGDDALAKLRAAVMVDPTNGMAQVRLATALAESGRLEDALRHYRKAVEGLPNYNPGVIGLAQTCRKLGLSEEAARAFQQALNNNPYDPTAATALAELELAAGRVEEAAPRLERLLRWMPENAVAHANLGVCYFRMARLRDAEREYRAALEHDPALKAPRLSLAALLLQKGATEEASFHLRQAAEHSGYADPSVLLPYSDFLIAQGDLRQAAALWTRGLEAKPGNAVMAAWRAWVCVGAEHWEWAEQTLAASMSTSDAQEHPIAATLSRILLEVHGDRPETAVPAVATLCADPSADARAARDRLQQGLKNYSLRHPDNPWPYYLMILLFQAEGREDGAHLALQAFEQVCTDPDWLQRARLLLGPPTSQPDAADP